MANRMLPMLPAIPTLIIRHPKENLKKCSLRGLEGRPDLIFLKFPKHHDDGHPIAGFDAERIAGRIVLALGAPELSPDDAGSGLLLIDGTWRYAARMARALDTWPAVGPTLIPRSLPADLRTAYPRKQTECPDPSAGLASVEALAAAYRLLGFDMAGLLDGYHWADEFRRLNGWE